MKAKLETPGPRHPLPHHQTAERMIAVTAAWQRMTDDLSVLRQHVARPGNSDPTGVRVLATMLTCTALMEQLLLLQIAVEGAEVD